MIDHRISKISRQSRDRALGATIWNRLSGEPSKAELRAMLAEAARNTAATNSKDEEGRP
ncbi:MAG TPA: hypothetical protein VKW08_07990 [Xanthobacteraceae bacterium]|nr:hypothetical protein [Xanthobacteraceae bacterium]